MNILLKLIVTTITILLIPYIIPGIHINGIYGAIVVSLVLGLINLTVKPILFILTIPINIITFGLFSLVTNAILFYLASTIVKGFTIDNFLSAFLGALILHLAVEIFGAIFKND